MVVVGSGHLAWAPYTECPNWESFCLLSLEQKSALHPGRLSRFTKGRRGGGREEKGKEERIFMFPKCKSQQLELSLMC